jgi:flagellar hook-associated protein 3 FlgL
VITRTTNQMAMLTAQRNLQTSSYRVDQAQQRASTLDKISKPSDDPAGTADALRIKAEQAANAQFSRNVGDGDGWLTIADSALSTTDDVLKKVRDLTVQGANTGALSQPARDAIATEIDGLKADLLAVANTSYNGRSVFAGTSDAGAAFRADFSYTGTPGSSVTRQIGAETSVRVDADGAAAFGTGADSVFGLLDRITADLRGGVNVGARLTEVDARLTAVRGVQSDVGARQSQIKRAEETLVDTKTTLEAQRAGIMDFDLGQAVLDLQMQNTSYQAALAVTAKVLQPTLMDFLR